MAEPLDLAKIMVEHADHGQGRWCGATPSVVDEDDPDPDNCLPYRLAAEVERLTRELAEAREQVWDECVSWFGIGHALPQWRVNQNVLLDAEEANPYRAALAGEGADQRFDPDAVIASLVPDLQREAAKVRPGWIGEGTADQAIHVTDEQILSRMKSAPMFDAGSDAWLLRIGRSLERLFGSEESHHG